MMRRFKLFMLAVLCTAVMFGGCSKTDENGLSSTDFGKKGTLYGSIFDAISGAPIKGDDTMKIYLMQGNDIRTPTKLITGATDDNAGEYAFTDIPVDLYSGNKTYKVKVIKSGYQTFVGTFNFTAAFAAPKLVTNYESSRLDDTYNKLCNIYIFPVGTTVGDVSIKVTANGELVNGATVRLQQNINTNSELTAVGGNKLGAAAGYTTNFSATTDSTGVATFNDTALVLGGNYTPIVEPITFNGQQFAKATGTVISLGANNVNQTVALAAVVTEPNPLYVVSASNTVPGTITSTGILSMTFNQAIALPSGFDSSFVGAIASGNAGTNVGFDTAAGYNPVTTCNIAATLSTDSKTLTLTPHFNTTAVLAGTSITYSYLGPIYNKNTQAAGISDGDADGDCLDQANDGYNVAISRRVMLKSY